MRAGVPVTVLFVIVVLAVPLVPTLESAEPEAAVLPLKVLFVTVNVTAFAPELAAFTSVARLMPEMVERATFPVASGPADADARGARTGDGAAGDVRRRRHIRGGGARVLRPAHRTRWRP